MIENSYSFPYGSPSRENSEALEPKAGSFVYPKGESGLFPLKKVKSNKVVPYPQAQKKIICFKKTEG